MKTPSAIDERVLRRLHEEAERRGVTVSALVEAGVHFLDGADTASEPPPPLPKWDAGGASVDAADREALVTLLARA